MVPIFSSRRPQGYGKPISLRSQGSDALEPDWACGISQVMEAVLYNDIQNPNAHQGKILPKKTFHVRMQETAQR
jgi:hypothetical protein